MADFPPGSSAAAIPQGFSAAGVSAADVSAAAPAVRCAVLAAEYDWSESEFGPQEQWSPVVGAVVGTMLEATVPMAYCHGARHAMVYNDRFAEILASRHPHSWGQPAPVVVPEIWSHPGLADVFDKVFDGGRPFQDDGELPGQDGRQHLGGAQAHFVGSYSAVRDSDGSVLGVLIVAVAFTSAVREIGTVIELATALASAVTVEDVAVAALRHAVDNLACGSASVCVSGGRPGGWRLTRWRRAEPWDESAARLPLSWSRVQDGTSPPEVDVAETGQPFVAESRRGVILPMAGPGFAGSFGFLGMEPYLPDAQMVVLEACALLIGDAMVRARQSEDRRGAAELLQRTLLPQAVPTVPGLILAGRYEPVKAGTAAGGDFYDGFTLPDGRLAFTIGDVMGRGIAAAQVMGQVRAALRGATLSNSDPTAVFTALDVLVSSLDLSWPAVPAYGQTPAYAGIAGFGGELFVTALLGLLDPETGELLLTSAGHLPPAVVRGAKNSGGKGDDVRVAEFAAVQPGPPLGIPGDRPVLRLALREGDALVAFTNGLLSQPDRSLPDGLGALLATLGTMARTEPRAICQHLVEELIGPDGPQDDCALLVLLRDSRAHLTSSVLVPPQAGAVRGSRVWARGQLESWGVDEDVTAAAVMGISELVTNVLLHAGTPARVSMELSDRLLVAVEDTGARGGPERAMHDDHAASRGRGLALVEALSDGMGLERGAAGSTVWFQIDLDRVGR